MSLWSEQFRNTAFWRAPSNNVFASPSHGKLRPYELTAERDGLVYRVQVKSTIPRVGPCSYSCGLPSEKRVLRLLKEVDFSAAYVIPADVW